MKGTLKILFLASNPAGTAPLHLDHEIKAIRQRIRAAAPTAKIQFEQEWAVSPEEIPASLMRHRPHIIHFSGHGNSNGELLMANSATKQAQPIEPAVLAQLFCLLPDNIICVVLNACYTQTQAISIAESIPVVVGMSRAVTDEGAIAFAAGFYEALAFGRSIKTAFQLGCLQLGLTGRITEQMTPHLTEKTGSDATGIYPVSEGSANASGYIASSQPTSAELSVQPDALQEPGTKVDTFLQQSKIPKPALVSSMQQGLSAKRRLNRLLRHTAAGMALGTVVFTSYQGWVWWRRRQTPAVCLTLQRDESACERGDKASCHRVFECQQLFCEIGNMPACFRKCSLFESGKGIASDPHKALSCYEEVCEKGYSDGCLHTALMLSEGRDVPRDERRAREIYTKLCNNSNGDSWACNNLANFQFESKSENRAQNIKSAEELYLNSCKNGNLTACSNLNIVHAFNSETKEKRKAFDDLKRDCEKDLAAACNAVGIQYAKGIDTLVDSDEAGKYLEKSCRLEHAIGCFNLGKLLGASKQESKESITYYRKACELGSRRGCFSLAEIFEFGKYEQKDETEALRLYKKACKQDDGQACFRVGTFLQYGKGDQKINIAAATQAYKKACIDGYKPACQTDFTNMGMGNDAQGKKVLPPKGFQRTAGHPDEPLGNQSDAQSKPSTADEDYKVSVQEGGRFGNCLSEYHESKRVRDTNSVGATSFRQADVLLLSSVKKHDINFGIEEEISTAKKLLNVASFHTSAGIDSLLAKIEETHPKVLHFSGHGSTLSPLWVDQHDDEFFINHDIWISTAKFLARCGVQCVFFNTCSSDEVASIMSKYVRSIISISGEISHRAAIELAKGFYTFLSNGSSFKEALSYAHSRSCRAQPGVKVHLFEKEEYSV